MYYKNRAEAGALLAEKLKKYKGQKNVIIAVNEGSVVVAAPIAKALECPITLMTTKAIALPGETNPVGYINQNGDFVFNKLLSEGQRNEFTSEYHTYIEQQKTEKLHQMNALVSGRGSIFEPNQLHGSNIMLVSDGLSSGPLLDSLIEYLKPIRINQLIVALPIACITTVDRLHMYADNLVVLDVAEFFMGTNHYYEDNKLPDTQTVSNALDVIARQWGRQPS